MQTLGKLIGIVGISLGLLVGCQSSQPREESPDLSSVSPVESPASSDVAATSGLLDAPRTYCYTAETETLTGFLNFNLDESGAVEGRGDATIHDEAAGYFSSYTQTFEGTKEGDRLNLAVVTQIEGSTLNEQETWTLTPTTLQARNVLYSLTDCSAVPSPTAEEPANPVAEAPIGADPAMEPVRVQFDPGSNFTVLENAVIRGTRDQYLLDAQAGQTMNLEISSLEENAVFDLVAPDGQTLEQEATEATVTLPESGDYQIIVGGTRGNASYQLRVEIN